MSIGAAAAKFEEACTVNGNLLTDIGKIFLKYHVESILGLILLHQHFSLSANEKLVSTNVVATPWDMESGAKELDDVQPSSWMFTPQGVAAYEFAHAPRAKPLDDGVSDFLPELARMLEHLKLTGTLGIFALEDEPANSAPKMEFTEGRANITLPFDISGPQKDSIEAMWQFHTASKSVGETATSKYTSQDGDAASTACVELIVRFQS